MNICPTGNVGVLGTVMEYKSSNGIAYKATEVKECNLIASKFEIPNDYTIMNAGKSFSQIQAERVSWKTKAFPEFNLKDTKGSIVNSTDLRGSIVIINFWYVNCLPCVQEMPELNELVSYYKNRSDIKFLAFTPDNDNKVADFLSKHNFNYSIIPGVREFISKLGINSFPTHLIIDKNGIVHSEITGYNGKKDEIKNTLIKVIDSL